MTDDTPPIPSGWTRIVVNMGELTNRLDVPSDRLDACVDDFECSFSMPLRTYRNTLIGDNAVGGIARQAATSGYNVTVGQAALWLLMHGADRVKLQPAREELWRLVVQEGGACIAATCSGYSRGWSFEVSPTDVTSLGDVANPLPAAPADVILN
jgi:hypothetical protein